MKIEVKKNKDIYDYVGKVVRVIEEVQEGSEDYYILGKDSEDELRLIDINTGNIHWKANWMMKDLMLVEAKLVVG